MKFSYNEYLDNYQISIKNKILSEITRDYRSLPSKSDGISSFPVHSSIEDFISNVAELISIDQETSDQKVLLKDDYSEVNILEDPINPNKELSGVVLYSLDRRSPGTMAGGNTWFSSERREIKPRIREVITNDPENLNQAKLIFSQWFDNRVCFKICTRTNKRSNELALWFENLMELNRVYFALKGTTKYYLDERESDSFEQIGNEGYHIRPYYYLVRTERTYFVTEQAINKIVISLTTGK
jgi:hypothetical protein